MVEGTSGTSCGYKFSLFWYLLTPVDTVPAPTAVPLEEGDYVSAVGPSVKQGEGECSVLADPVAHDARSQLKLNISQCSDEAEGYKAKRRFLGLVTANPRTSDPSPVDR